MNKTTSIFLVVAATLGLSLSAAVTVLPVAYAHDCPEQGCVTDGRMTGGGRLATSMIVTHGFELHCSVSDLPNNLEVNWDGGNKFHLDTLTNVKCLDSPTVASPNPPPADFDLMEGGGTGTYNGEDGATIYFVLTDAGEPGKDDRARLLIRDEDGTTVLDVNALLRVGNHQAH